MIETIEWSETHKVTRGQTDVKGPRKILIEGAEERLLASRAAPHAIPPL
jgi:hypothetical protein